MIRVHIKRSKTNPFRKGINLFVGKTGTALCPVAALLGYLQSCCMDPGPLFRYEDDRPLTRPRFTEAIRSVLGRAGADQKKFCTHRFRIGAAITAAAKGIKDSVLKPLGRWESAVCSPPPTALGRLLLSLGESEVLLFHVVRQLLGRMEQGPSLYCPLLLVFALGIIVVYFS